MRRTGLSALARTLTVVVAMLWLVVACANGSLGTPTQSPAGAPMASATAVTAATPTNPQSAEPSSTAPSASSTLAASASPNPNAPPAGWLSAGGNPVKGLSGTYCWHSICADVPAFTELEPDLPQITTGSGVSQLSFSLEGSYPFASWGASYVDDSGDVVPLGGEQSSFDPDASHPSITPQATTATFPYPPSGGEWIVQVFVRFVEGGDASYGWKVAVP